MSARRVVVLDHGSGNVHSAVRALERVGAQVELTADRQRALDAHGLLLPGVGNFHACVRGMRAAEAPRIVDVRLAGGRPVLGVCVGMQALFESSTEPNGTTEEGLAEWPGTVERLQAPIVPHMGWTEVDVPAGSHPLRRASSPSASTSSTRMPCAPGRFPSPPGAFEVVAPGSPTRPTASGSSPPSRTVHCPRPSSTPRSRARQACTCSRTGSARSELPAHPTRDPTVKVS